MLKFHYNLPLKKLHKLEAGLERLFLLIIGFTLSTIISPPTVETVTQSASAACQQLKIFPYGDSRDEMSRSRGC